MNEKISEKKEGQVTYNLGRRATLKDVAKLAGVTPAMASFTLSGKRRASEQTFKAVTQAARDLGYVPNPHAQRLANGGCDKTIALLWPIDLGISTQQASFIQHRLDEAGFTVEMHVTPMFVSDVENKQAKMLSTLCRQEPRAIICRTTALEESAVAQLRRYAQDGGTVICYGDVNNNAFDRVIFDGPGNIYKAANHLIDLGHRKIGLSIHAAELNAKDPFPLEFRRALKERKIEVRKEWMWANCCYEDAGACLAKSFLELKDRPTAMCVINDVTAATFVSHIHRAGVVVPRDLSVVGYDDTPAARHALVPLTTVTHPVEGVMRPLMQMLLSRLDGSYQGPPRCTHIQGEVVVRDSTAPIT